MAVQCRPHSSLLVSWGLDGLRGGGRMSHLPAHHFHPAAVCPRRLGPGPGIIKEEVSARHQVLESPPFRGQVLIKYLEFVADEQKAVYLKKVAPPISVCPRSPLGRRDPQPCIAPAGIHAPTHTWHIDLSSHSILLQSGMFPPPLLARGFNRRRFCCTSGLFGSCFLSNARFSFKFDWGRGIRQRGGGGG